MWRGRGLHRRALAGACVEERGAHDRLGEGCAWRVRGSTSGGLKVHILCTYVLLSCVCIYLRSEESHKETQEHSAHFTCGCTVGVVVLTCHQKFPPGSCYFGKLYCLNLTFLRWQIFPSLLKWKNKILRSDTSEAADTEWLDRKNIPTPHCFRHHS